MLLHPECAYLYGLEQGLGEGLQFSLLAVEQVDLVRYLMDVKSLVL